MSYYILDCGHRLLNEARKVKQDLLIQGHHVIIYMTDCDALMCVEEVTEDEFLDHFSPKQKHE